MEFSGVYHKTSEQMSYALDEDRLIVNIKTGYDVKQVFIHYGDPYEAGILGGKDKWFPDRRTASDGWPYAAVLYCTLDEPGRYQSHTGMGKRNDLVSDFPGSVLQRDTGKKRR